MRIKGKTNCYEFFLVFLQELIPVLKSDAYGYHPSFLRENNTAFQIMMGRIINPPTQEIEITESKISEAVRLDHIRH